MTIPCPHCGQPLSRPFRLNPLFAVAGPLIGMLSAASRPMSCKSCGPILRSELPLDVRRRLALRTATRGLVAVALAIVCWLFLSWWWHTHIESILSTPTR